MNEILTELPNYHISSYPSFREAHPRFVEGETIARSRVPYEVSMKVTNKYVNLIRRTQYIHLPTCALYDLRTISNGSVHGVVVEHRHYG